MLNCKEKNHSVFNLILTVRAFQKKVELFAIDILYKLLHFPKLLEQRKGNTDIKYAQFIKKLIVSFKQRFDDFVLGEQLLLFIQNPLNLIFSGNKTYIQVDGCCKNSTRNN